MANVRDVDMSNESLGVENQSRIVTMPSTRNYYGSPIRGLDAQPVDDDGDEDSQANN